MGGCGAAVGGEVGLTQIRLMVRSVAQRRVSNHEVGRGGAACERGPSFRLRPSGYGGQVETPRRSLGEGGLLRMRTDQNHATSAISSRTSASRSRLQTASRTRVARSLPITAAALARNFASIAASLMGLSAVPLAWAT